MVWPVTVTGMVASLVVGLGLSWSGCRGAGLGPSNRAIPADITPANKAIAAINGTFVVNIARTPPWTIAATAGVSVSPTAAATVATTMAAGAASLATSTAHNAAAT